MKSAVGAACHIMMIGSDRRVRTECIQEQIY